MRHPCMLPRRAAVARRTSAVEKIQPIGICDLCLQPIPPHLGNYTSKGSPRLHCSRECRNTANSRAGAPIKSQKTLERMQRGEWANPAELNPPDPQAVAEGIRKARRREVQEGRWRNPGLTPEAREINSQPHKHSGPLAEAIERLNAGASTNDLTPEQQEAHRAYRRQLEAARREEINAWHRERYARRQASMTEAEREAQREKWRQGNRARAERTQAAPPVQSNQSATGAPAPSPPPTAD